MKWTTSFILFLIIISEALSAIEDNSFFLEEAYNQPSGTYQLIQKYETSKEGEQEFELEFEMPITHHTHQFSFSMGRLREADVSASTFSDLVLNYRWQLVKSKTFLLTERLSAIFPTGETNNGSKGVTGYEWLQSATVIISDKFVNHWNLGITLYPNSKSALSKERKTTKAFSGGTSFIYLFHDRLNFLFESTFQTGEEIDALGDVGESVAFTISPGLRFSFDYEKYDTQIVPGLAFPITFEDPVVNKGVLLYFSVESTFE